MLPWPFECAWRTSSYRHNSLVLMSLLMSEIIVIDSLNDGLLESLEVFRGAEYGTRKELVSYVFLCMCCVASPALLFIDVFHVMLLSLGVATRVTTCPYLLCMMALVATFSRCCVATSKQPSKRRGI